MRCVTGELCDKAEGAGHGVLESLVYSRHAKRWLDILGSTAALVVGLPVILLVALAIGMESRGPIFFRQVRIGRGREPFAILKFRTMSDRPGKAGEPNHDEGVFDDQDQRITRVGRRLRRLSLDELPQLLNVLRGDMSLVGPRPIIPEQLAAVDSESNERFDVHPGLTGLAQVNGRRALSWPQQLCHDVEYARRVSFVLDLKIILRTIGVIVTGSGIYGTPQDNWRQYVEKSDPS